MPCLHSPSVGTMLPSASMHATSSKNELGCRAQTSSRDLLMMSIRRSMSAGVKRRQKSPAVVGSGIVRAPNASRKAASLRLTSMSSRTTPPANVLNAMLRTWSDSE